MKNCINVELRDNAEDHSCDGCGDPTLAVLFEIRAGDAANLWLCPSCAASVRLQIDDLLMAHTAAQMEARFKREADR
jgi:hypothetical protein